MPVQQSLPNAQESFACPQKDEAWQVPPVQSAEQHCAFEVQPLPRVEHAALRGAHLPAVQVWLQQSPLTAQAKPSDVQAGYMHRLLLQSPLQQSPLVAHAAPNLRHVALAAPLDAPPNPVKTSGSSEPSPISLPTVASPAPPSADETAPLEPPHPAATPLAATIAERPMATHRRISLLLVCMESLSEEVPPKHVACRRAAPARRTYQPLAVGPCGPAWSLPLPVPVTRMTKVRRRPREAPSRHRSAAAMGDRLRLRHTRRR
jgi:hypothetical protein